ncbi:unnamed protein product [Rhodiola kirilowii]
MDPKSKKSMGEKLKQFHQKYKKAKDELSRWEDLQTRFVSQFRAASDIIQRLPILLDSNNFGSLKNYPDIPNKVLGKQMDSLNKIMVLMNQTMYEFGSVIKSLEKTVRDSRQLIKGESDKQLQLWIGVRPSLAYCMEGLETLRNVHNSEFLLKKSLFTALSTLVFKPNADDLCALQRILVDQPNISKEEVDSIFDRLIFPEDS